MMHTNRDSAADPGLPSLSRRTLLTAASVAPFAPFAAFPVSAGEADPILPLYREWLDARRAWRELSDLPGNGNWDDPRSLAAEAREDAALEAMLTLKPTSLEGVGALAALAWAYICPGTTDPEEFAEQAQFYDCQTVMAIWRACTGKDGYPVT